MFLMAGQECSGSCTLLEPNPRSGLRPITLETVCRPRGQRGHLLGTPKTLSTHRHPGNEQGRKC